MKKYDVWLSWFSFVAGVSILIVVLISAEEIMGSNIEKSDMLFFLLGVILPAIISSLLALFKKFWWLLLFGIWFAFLGTLMNHDGLDYSQILIISALILFFTPFINIVLRKKE